MPTPRPFIAAGLAAVVGLVLSGCITGQRPSFEDEQPAEGATGNEAIDAVLQQLDAAGSTTLTAVYEISAATGDDARAAVVIADDTRTSITVGDRRYLLENGAGITCDLTADECEASINDAHISNLQITHDFFGPAFAQRLRVDADRRIADPTGFEQSIAGQDAVCVTVPVTGGDKLYCALDAGVLARYQGADTLIDLIRYRPRPDENRFATGR